MKKLLSLLLAVLMLLPAIPALPAKEVDAASVAYQRVEFGIQNKGYYAGREQVGKYYFWTQKNGDVTEICSSRSAYGEEIVLARIPFDPQNNHIVTNGTYVYYVDGTKQSKPKIMRVQANGKKRTTVYSMKANGVNLAGCYGSRVYFYAGNTGSADDSLCSVTTSGKSFKRYCNDAYPKLESSRYLYLRRGTMTHIFDCKQNKFVRKLDCWDSLQIVGSKIYYIDYSKGNGKRAKLISASLSGGSAKTLLKNVYIEDYYSFDGSNSHILLYYKNASDQKKAIYSGYNIKTGKKVRYGTYLTMANKLESEREVMTPTVIGLDWRFEMRLNNNSQEELTPVKLEIIHTNNGKRMEESWIYSGDRLSQVGLDFGALQPGNSWNWNDGHPIVASFNGAEYHFTFQNSKGKTWTMKFVFDMRNTQAVEYTFDSSYDDYLEPAYTDTDWHFTMNLVNNTKQSLTLQKLEIRQKLYETQIGPTNVITGQRLQEIGLDFGTLKPGKSHLYVDGHPIVSWFNVAEYHFYFKNESGKTVKKVYKYKLCNIPPQTALDDYSKDNGKDLLTLRYDADFAVEVYPGIEWVPARALGDSRYTNAQVYAMLSKTPEQKQDSFSTLYEALQLYQVGGFYTSDDNIRIFENGVNWEHHKPGYHAVRTNTGCCATDSNWLRYILDGDYDEVGYISTSQRDGSGHIYNYIKQDGYYYIIDLTHYRTDWVVTAVESGNLDDYYNSDYILGNIHKTRSLETFADYVQDRFGDPPAVMETYTAENCAAVDGIRDGDKTVIIYEDSVQVKVLYKASMVELRYITAPKFLPDWSKEPSYQFPK